MVSSTPRPYFTPGKDPVPILQDAGWAPVPVWKEGKSIYWFMIYLRCQQLKGANASTQSSRVGSSQTRFYTKFTNLRFIVRRQRLRGAYPPTESSRVESN